MKHLLLIILIVNTIFSYGQPAKKYKLTDSQWKAKLTTEEYNVLRRRGTEKPFTGKYWNNKKKGKYTCAGCNHPLFSSETKYKSGTGWPSFYDVIENGIELGVDNDLGYSRNEVHCAICNGHLGHVFNDGPPPTNLRYCINSVALKFEPE